MAAESDVRCCDDGDAIAAWYERNKVRLKPDATTESRTSIVKAFIVSTARDIYTHKLLMLRALLVGLGAAIITGQLVVLPLMRRLLPYGLGGENGFSFSWSLFWTVWAPIHGVHGALVGWIIARFHCEHRVAALIVFVCWGLPAVVPDLFRLGVDHSPRFFPILAQTFFPVACLLLGGLALVGSATRNERRGDANDVRVSRCG
jgi:hypothetical protein